MHEAIIARVFVSPHPDKEVHSLAVGRVLNETVIVSNSTHDGELGIYFPCDLQLSEQFAEANNLIRRKDENGKNVGGMFENNRRVRVQTFRGVKSHGFWCPLSFLSQFGDVSTLIEGDKLQEFNNVKICNKYYNWRTLQLKDRSYREGSPRAVKKNIYFPEHKDTEQLKYSLRQLSAGDNLVVTLKVHGTSQRVARNYVQFPDKWYDKVLNFFGIKRTHFLNGTRRVNLKTGYSYWPFKIKIIKALHRIGIHVPIKDYGYYSREFRTKVAKKFKPFLEKHMQVFFEVVGWENEISKIMPSHHTSKSKDRSLSEKYGEEITYSYGCNVGEFDIYVYRIAYVLPNGQVNDLTWDQVKEKCNSWGIKHVPELDRFTFDGNVDSLIDKIDNLSDGPDPIDPNHIREGVCVRVDSSTWKCFKNKGWTFKVLEGIARERDDYIEQEEVS